MTDLARQSKHHSRAVATDVEVTDDPVVSLIEVYAPFATDVIGEFSADAATTFTLEGSHDGTKWVEDTAGNSATTSEAFRFAKRWVYYRITAVKDTAGTTNASATLVALS